MTKLQKLTIRASEIRTELSEIAGKDELTEADETRLNELRNEYQSVEKRIQALTIAEGEPAAPAPQPADRTDLARRSDIGQIFRAAVGGANPDGATAELQSELKLRGNQIPLELLRGAGRPNQLETRAVTPAPSDTGRTQSEIIPYVFPYSCAMFCSVGMPTVPVGERVYPVLTTPATVSAPAAGATVAETTGAFAANLIEPSRLQASFFFRREDRASFEGMGESLRMNLADALADGLDNQMFNNEYGFFGSSGLTDKAISLQITFNSFINNVMASVDGRYAGSAMDLRTVIGVASHGYLATLRRANANDLSVVDTLAESTGGVRVSANVPAVASKKQGAVVRRGMLQDMVMPLWEGVEVIEDPYTKAATGEIVLTAILLYGIRILRADGFQRLTIQVEN